MPPLLPIHPRRSRRGGLANRAATRSTRLLRWCGGSILGTEKQDALVARLLHEVPVLLSGVHEIDGRDYLYLGIDRAYWGEHGGEHIYTALKQRFPITPLFVEASDGVQPAGPEPVPPEQMSGDYEEEMSDTPATEEPAPLLLDPFEEGLGAWQADSGWKAQALGAATIPGAGDGNLVAQTQGCSFCFLTLKTPMDLSAYESVTLSFYRYMDADTGNLEFLGVEIGNNGSYKRVQTYGKQEGDGQWHHETFTLTGQDLSDAFILRFFGATRNAATTFALDNVMLIPTPGTVVIPPIDPEPPEDEAPANLTIASLSISPTHPASGTSVSVRLTIHNDGAETASSETVRLYRHRTRTRAPTTGGTRLSATTTTGSLAPGASVTRTLSATTPSVTSATTFYYYACADPADGETETDDNCSPAPATVTVQPTAGATPQQPPDLAISSVTVSPTNPESNGLITMQITVHNSGAGSASSEIIWVYRHYAPTANPTVNGFRIPQTARSGSLAAGASATHSLPTVVASVTSPTTHYYYACVDTAAGEQRTDNNCSANPAEVTVRAVSEPEPEEELIPEATAMGGDLLYARKIGKGSSSTITLGGLTMADGTKGFVVSGHGVGDTVANYTKTNTLVFDNTRQRFLGKVAKMPRVRRENGRNLIDADSAFIAYPDSNTSDCSLTWNDSAGRTFCLDLGRDEHVETVQPLTIRGKNGTVYTVIGSRRPTRNLAVQVSGARSGIIEGNRVVSGRLLSRFLKSDGFILHHYTYDINGGGETAGGDSGSPVYTIPDADGNTQIVGILVGEATIADEKLPTFNAWTDVAKELDLKAVGN